MVESILSRSIAKQRWVRSVAGTVAAMALFFLSLWPDDLAAQGPPVDTGSHIPVALWFIGAGVLGIVMVYGITHNRNRTRAEVQRTEQATRELYARDDKQEG